jgi:hypothetical protein
MGIFSRLLHGKRDRDRSCGAPQADARQIDEAVERIAGTIPQLRLARQYQARLAPVVRGTLDYAAKLVESLPAPRDAATGAWLSDPYLHAYFATPDDVCPAFGRSHDLRAWFDEHSECAEVYAVLGMDMTERRVLGAVHEGDTTRTDVRQTTVSFSDHRVRICGRTDADLREEIVRRIVDQLALEALARIAEDKSRRDALEQERALLKARVQLMQRQGTGMHAVLACGAPVELAEFARLQRQIEENERNLGELGLQTEIIERRFDIVHDVFADPAAQAYVRVKRLRLDKMNVVVEEGGARPGEDLDFRVARIPATPSETRAFAIVRFVRTDLPPAGRLFDDAHRLLV